MCHPPLVSHVTNDIWRRPALRPTEPGLLRGRQHFKIIRTLFLSPTKLIGTNCAICRTRVDVVEDEQPDRQLRSSLAQKLSEVLEEINSSVSCGFAAIT